ncbi:AP-3 complex subunit delta-1 [Boothiomyces sp. JEL0866]|nr:AP-3 complex subunit delta-1 [Boothiomyces sp. JEL0866]KAJ3321989.1 AP-3 complex subunit delta-1 [Boothiomyces sp. JEL0866]
MFEKSVTDLIRGIRANKHNEQAFIRTAINEIQTEVKQDLELKANAIQKLMVLHLMGYDMSWSHFHIIEVMSSQKLAHKKIGYMAVNFDNIGRDVLQSEYGYSNADYKPDKKKTVLALHALAQIVTPDLARDLHVDIIGNYAVISGMLNHSSVYIRKRALLVLYRIFLKYPEALKIAFPKLKDKLNDDDPTVVSTAVTVICELAKKNPHAYLPLAPQLFALLTGGAILLTLGSNNWTLIKIIKLFSALTPFEPRLIKKLATPLVNIIETTRAMSVVYECINTIITGGMISEQNIGTGEDEKLVSVCMNKLKVFLEQSDQNLKYLGLYAVGKLLQVRPQMVSEHRDAILKCMEDEDVSIRTRALELISGLVTPKSLFGIVKRLLVHLAESETNNLTLDEVNYRSFVAKTVILSCSKDMYANITNFEWYIHVLVDLSFFPGVEAGNLIRDQLIDVCVRVKETPLLSDESLLSGKNNSQVLYAAAWICGEYADSSSDLEKILYIVIAPENVGLDASIQVVYLFTFLKLFSKYAKQISPETFQLFSDSLDIFIGSPELSVQERAITIKQILADCKPKSDNPWSESQEVGELPWAAGNIEMLFEGEFNPVSQKTVEKITAPDDLTFDEWLVEPPLDLPPARIPSTYIPEPPTVEVANVDRSAYMLGSNKSLKADDTSNIPIVRLSIEEPLQVGDKPLQFQGRFSSVMSRPEVKHYELNKTTDGIVETEESPKKAKKKKSKKGKKEKEDSCIEVELGVVLWQNQEICLRADKWTYNSKESLQIEFHASLHELSTDAGIDFAIAPSTEVKEKNLFTLACISTKKEPLTAHWIGQLYLENMPFIPVQFDLPYVVNLPTLFPMTPEKFLHILQNPPSNGFGSTGSTNLIPPVSIEFAEAVSLISKHLNFTTVEILPNAASIYGYTWYGVHIVGLVKERTNKHGKTIISVEIKSGNAATVDLVVDELSQLVTIWSVYEKGLPAVDYPEPAKESPLVVEEEFQITDLDPINYTNPEEELRLANLSLQLCSVLLRGNEIMDEIKQQLKMQELETNIVLEKEKVEIL